MSLRATVPENVKGVTKRKQNKKIYYIHKVKQKHTHRSAGFLGSLTDPASNPALNEI